MAIATWSTRSRNSGVRSLALGTSPAGRGEGPGVVLERLPDGVGDRPADPQLGRGERGPVGLRQPLRRGPRGRYLFGVHPVEEAGRHGLVGGVHLGQDHGPVEVRRGQPLPADLDGRPGHGQRDGHLVGGDPVRPGRAEPEVAGQHEKDAHGDGVAGAGHDHRRRERQQPGAQLEAGPHQRGRGGTAGPQHAQVEAGREDPVPPGQDDGGARRLRPVQRRVDLVEHRHGQRVDLAVVHGDGGDRIALVVGHQVPHAVNRNTVTIIIPNGPGFMPQLRPGPGRVQRRRRGTRRSRHPHPSRMIRPPAPRARIGGDTHAAWRGVAMAKPFHGTINVDIRDSEPDWAPFEPPKAPDGAPSVVYIVLDDVGYSAMSCYGGPIDTPNIDRIAANGTRYTQWHTTALCSPTRSCLLTGRNHTRNSMACITEAAVGFPNASGMIPPENGMLPEILGELGWNTYMTGKWHLCPSDEMNLAATRRNWPTGRGFERYYGFLGAETNQSYPDLVYDNHPVDQPKSPEEGYHFGVDITDKAIEFIRDAKAIAPDKPFFLYYAPGAAHAPHHAPREWIERYAGQFDMGYEAIREQTLARQKEMGIVPAGTQLPPLNPIGTPQTRTGPDGQPFPPLDYTKPWDSLSAEEKRLFSRMAEVYAGFLAHADHHIGRLLDYLEETGQ